MTVQEDLSSWLSLGARELQDSGFWAPEAHVHTMNVGEQLRLAGWKQGGGAWMVGCDTSGGGA